MSKRILSFLLAIYFTVTSLIADVTLSDTAITSDAAEAYREQNYQVFRQTDQNYGNYDPSNGSGCTIQKNGSGIMSIVNAVYHLTGNIMSIQEVFDWAYSTGGYGTTGTTRYTIYPSLQPAFGAKYGFTVGVMAYASVSHTSFINHLQNGGTAIVRVYNHFMCIAGYDSVTGRYLLIDSDPDWDNRHSSAGGNWMTAAELTGSISPFLMVDWWCLLSKGSASGTKKYTATANVAEGSGSVFFYDDVRSAKFTAGTNVFFRPIPASGYKVSSITVNGTEVAVQNDGNPSTYMFTMPSEDCAISVGFSSGGSDHANITYTSATSYTLPSGIVARTDSARPNSYVGLFTEDTTSYSKSTAITYFSAPAYYYINNSTAEGYTTQLQSGKIGGNYSVYGSTGTFKVVTFDISGNVYSNDTITISGNDTYKTAITSCRVYGPSPIYKATATVVTGQGSVHFGNNVTSTTFRYGTTVYYQVTPAEGYKATEILVYGTPQTIKNNGGNAIYNFIMEEENVTVSVKFEQDSTSNIESFDVIVNVNTSDIEAVSGKTVATAMTELNTLFGSTTTITKNGEAVSNTATLGTGMVATANGKTYDIIIEGDVDGDGAITVADATATMAGIRDTFKVTGAYAKAALAVNKKTSGALSILEVMAILNAI